MTEEQAKTATLDELRDWLAGDDGWNYEPLVVNDDGAVAGGWWRWVALSTLKARSWCKNPRHPHPPTLDGAAAALPEGWAWWRLLGFREWYAAQPDANGRITGWGVTIPDTGDEIADRYRLAVLCRLAEKAVAK